MKPIPWKMVLAEFFGCMALEFLSGGAVIASAMAGNLVTAALGMGFALAVVTFRKNLCLHMTVCRKTFKVCMRLGLGNEDVQKICT
jgi:hypothetical protein